MFNKWISSFTVKSRILIVLLAVIFCTTAGVASITAVQIRYQMNELLEERLIGNANVAFGIFDIVRMYTLLMLDTAVGHAYLGFNMPGYSLDFQLQHLYHTMNKKIEGVRTYENIIIFDTDLQITAVVNKYSNVPDIRMFYRYFEDIMKGTWLSPVFDHDGILHFMFTQPIRSGDNLLGFAAIVGNTQMFTYFLNDFVQACDSFINIADRTGIIFFSNLPESYIGRHLADLKVVEATGKIAYSSFDPYLDWTIISFFDAQALEDISVAILASLFPLLIGISIAAILIMLIIHKSLKPLQTLAESAKEVAKGNMAVTFRVNRNDEISQVSNAFIDIVRVLNILRSNFKKAENAMVRGDTEYSLLDSRLGGIYDHMMLSTSNIVQHMQKSMAHAEAASKAKSNFLSKMSHEIRTPMNSITGMAELILKDSNLSLSSRDQAATIKQSGDHLLSIINDILDLSKVESGKLEINNADYLFHSTVHDVVSIIKMRMAKPEVRFVAYMQHNIPNQLYGDEVRTRQVLLNILSNALKYTKKGHFSLDITYETKSEEEILLIMKIKDTGLGIREEDLQHLFKEFAQFDHDKNKGVEGTGLGLAITENLVHLMGGSIEVKSTYGVGSEFIVILPQKYKQEIYEPPNFPEPPKILLYCRTTLNTEYISRALIDLDIKHHVIYNENELKQEISTGGWNYIFAEADLAYIAQNVIRNTKNHVKLVMLSDSYDAAYETRDGQDFFMLIMPAYLISIINVLTGGHIVESSQAEFFNASEAKVLLVDDIETNLKVGTGLLNLFGINPDTCDNGKDAIKAIKQTNYDLVLMDHMMPEMDGVETVKTIRNMGFINVPIAALTANAIVGAREMFLQNGFDDFLSKPIELVKLSLILSKWIPEEKQTTAAEIHEDLDISIEGINVKKGIQFSGGAENYISTLKIFYKDGLKKIEEISDFSNLTLYTTYVHALKSAGANIGADTISKEAEILESAGIKGEVGFIANNNDKFIKNLSTLLKNIEKALPVCEKIDTAKLKGDLASLKTALESFNLREIDRLLEVLSDCEEVQEIVQTVFIGDYEQAGILIDAYFEQKMSKLLLNCD